MGVIHNIIKRFRREGSADSSAESRLFGSRYGSSSVLDAVGARDLDVATVYRCIRLISEAVASLPLEYKTLNKGIFETDYSSRLNYLLSVEPDYCYNAFDFWCDAIQQVLMHGNAYIYPRRDKTTNVVKSLTLCSPHSVSYDTATESYTISDYLNGLHEVVSEWQIIHLRGLSLDGRTGLSVLSFARLSMTTAKVGDSETLNRFKNGGNVRGIISNGSTTQGYGGFQDEQLNNAARDIDDDFQSGRRIVAMPGQGVGFQQLSLSSTDMQFLESRKFSVREICRFFGVHPSYVFDDTSNNYKSAEMANVAFLSNTLNPILVRIEAEFNRKLTHFDGYYNQKFEFNRMGLYACDLESRATYQANTIASGIYTVNEWRKIENKQPIEGGDTPLVSANLKSINELNSYGINTATNNNE